MLLKQSTAAVIPFGPFLSPTDAVTLVTSLVSALDHATTGIFLAKNGGAGAVRHATVTATTYDSYGNYLVTLDATDVNTLGRLRVMFAAAASCLPVWRDFQVVPAAVYDALVGGTSNLPTDVLTVEGADATDALQAAADAAVTANTNLAAAELVLTHLATALEIDSGNYRYTVAALANAPVTAAGPDAATIAAEVDSVLSGTHGAGGWETADLSGVPAAVDAELTSSHGAGSWEAPTVGDVAAEVASVLSASHGAGGWETADLSGVPAAVDAELTSSHGAGSWLEGPTAGEVAAEVDSTLSSTHGADSWEGVAGPDAATIAAEVDSVLSGTHGAGDWEGGGSGPDAATIAAEVDSVLSGSHGAGDWITGSGSLVPSVEDIVAGIAGMDVDGEEFVGVQRGMLAWIGGYATGLSGEGIRMWAQVGDDDRPRIGGTVIGGIRTVTMLDLDP